MKVAAAWCHTLLVMAVVPLIGTFSPVGAGSSIASKSAAMTLPVVVDAEHPVGVDVRVFGLGGAVGQERHEVGDTAGTRGARNAGPGPLEPGLDRELREIELGRVAEVTYPPLDPSFSPEPIPVSESSLDTVDSFDPLSTAVTT